MMSREAHNERCNALLYGWLPCKTQKTKAKQRPAQEPELQSSEVVIISVYVAARHKGIGGEMQNGFQPYMYGFCISVHI